MSISKGFGSALGIKGGLGVSMVGVSLSLVFYVFLLLIVLVLIVLRTEIKSLS